MIEPTVVYATIRESDGNEFDIECRFSDGQKFAAVQVDGNFLNLAQRIAHFLSTGDKG